MKPLVTVLLGLAALAVASPDVSVDNTVLVYSNDAATTFHCVHDVEVIACAVRGACTTVEVCDVKCIEKELGASCAVSHKVETTNIQARNPVPDPGELKHYECADDRKSVLICRYGFCSIDRYCNKGTKCRNSCNCCKKTHALAGDIDASNNDEELHDDDATDSDALAVRTDAPDVDFEVFQATCTPGDYTCAGGFNGTNAHIKVCNRFGAWQLSADCGSGQCIEDTNDASHCVAKRDSVEVAQATCLPGDYTCAGGFNGTNAHIKVCNRSGAWQLSADCGSGRCFEDTSGSPHCVAKRDSVDAVPAPNDQLTAEDVYDCTDVGKFSCSEPTARWIFVCNAKKRWVQSADCGRDGACQTGSDGLPHCYTQKLDDASSLRTRDKYDCEIVSQYDCSADGSRYIMVCNAQKRWVMSSDCGRNNGCRKGSDGLPHCYANMDDPKEATTLSIVAKDAASTGKA